MPSLSNAHTPVHTAKAPSLLRMVLPATVTLRAPLSAHTLIAASGDGTAASDCGLIRNARGPFRGPNASQYSFSPLPSIPAK